MEKTKKTLFSVVINNRLIAEPQNHLTEAYRLVDHFPDIPGYRAVAIAIKKTGEYSTTVNIDYNGAMVPVMITFKQHPQPEKLRA